jgi:hypothetical protein
MTSPMESTNKIENKDENIETLRVSSRKNSGIHRKE